MEQEKSNLRLVYYYPVILAIVLISGILAGAYFFHGSQQKKYDKIQDIISYIKSSYVDSVNTDKLTKEAISGMLASLDPHSSYIPPAEFNDANDPLKGNFEGIGIEFRILKDTITVMNTIPGGPSERIGIHAGDKIIQIDNKNVAKINISNDKVVHKLKGKRGTQVKVTIYRTQIKKTKDFLITRDIIPTYSIDVACIVTEHIGYIRLTKFSATTVTELIKALMSLKSQGMTKLILDLRGNSGGYLDAAINLADEFLPKKKLIVFTKGIHHQAQYAYATQKGHFEKEDLVVLIDEWSASASEIIAGAIQDNDRGLIIGRRSFGKGLVQDQLDLPDGSAVRLTIARYYTPSGRCIQKPYDKGTEQYYHDIYKRFTDGELEHPDSIHFPDSLKFKTSKGKVVYGGGGIMPDIYIPVKTSRNFSYFNRLADEGIFYQFTFDYVDKNKMELKKYSSTKDFIDQFSIDNNTFENIIRYAEQAGIKRNDTIINNSKTEIISQLKAIIGRYILGEEAYYLTLNKTDDVFKKAIEVLNKN